MEARSDEVPVMIVVKDGLLSSSPGEIQWKSGEYWSSESRTVSTSTSGGNGRPFNNKENDSDDERDTIPVLSMSKPEDKEKAKTLLSKEAVKYRLPPHVKSSKSNDIGCDCADVEQSREDTKFYGGFFDESFKALCEEHLQMERGNRTSVYEALEVDYPLDFDEEDDSDYEFAVDDDSSDDEEILTPLTPRPNPLKRNSEPQVQVIDAGGDGISDAPAIEETVYLTCDSHSIKDGKRPSIRKGASDFLVARGPEPVKETRRQVTSVCSSTRTSSLCNFIPNSSTNTLGRIPHPDRSQSAPNASNFSAVSQEAQQHIVLHLCPEHHILSSSPRPCLCPSTLEMYELGKLEETKYDTTSTHRIARVFSSLRHKKDSLSIDKIPHLKNKKSRLRKLSRKPSQSPFSDLSEIVNPSTPSIRDDEGISIHSYVPDVDSSLGAFAEWLSNPHPFEGNSLRASRTSTTTDQSPFPSPKVHEQLEYSKCYFSMDNCSLASQKRLSSKSLVLQPEFIPDEATNHLRDWDLFLHIHKTVSSKDKKIQSLIGDGASRGFADVPLEYIDDKGLPAIMASKAPMAYFLTHLLQSQHHQWLMFLWEFVTLEDNVGPTRLKQMARMYELYLNPEGYLFLGWDVLASEENFTSVNPSRLLPQLKDRAWRILTREFDVWWGQEHPLMRRMFKTIGTTSTRVDILKLREAFSYPLHTITATFNELLSKNQGALGPDIVYEDSPRGKLVRHHNAIRTLQRKFCETVMGVDSQFFNIKIGDFKEIYRNQESPNQSLSDITGK